MAVLSSKSARGSTRLQGAKRGFITALYDEHEEYSTAVVTGSGFDTENLVLRLAPSACFPARFSTSLETPFATPGFRFTVKIVARA